MLFVRNILFFIGCCLLHTVGNADVVKPALIEISVNEVGEAHIEIRASIEALLTGINGRYKNTKDSPNAQQYDVLRGLQPELLLEKFKPFEPVFLSKIQLVDDENKRIPLRIDKVDIPERGYVKVPRISLIQLSGQVDLTATSVRWYYPLSFADHATRLRQVNNQSHQYHWSEWQWVREDVFSEPFSLTEIVAKKPLSQTITNYIELGYLHILPRGMDHILFIFGLFLFSSAIKSLMWQVTMFTIAHTITLGLAMNGIIDIPESIVQPLIALSIVYVGIENIVANTLHRSRLALVFGFGLLHGLGFAQILLDMGMPENAFATALISFNVGVELGQLSILLGAFLLIGLWFGRKKWYRELVVIPASLLISIIAFYWFIDRLSLPFFTS